MRLLKIHLELYIISTMKDRALFAIKKFLELKFVPGKPLLVGYSGGPDSKALLYLLIACKRFYPLEIHVAHVDHGWREESAQEARQLAEEVHRLGLPWHLKTADPSQFKQGNLEEQGRLCRLEFFSQLCAALPFQAVLLGHHADDQAEVVMKRIFEGASLYSLGGLSPDSILGYRIWRPLLSLRKEELVAWLEKMELSFFSDPTNRSLEFLRGRMREKMVPYLSEVFGKGIEANLCYLGSQSQELKEYFSQLNAPLLDALVQGRTGACFHFNSFLPLPRLQLKYLVKEVLVMEKASASRQILEEIVDTLLLNQKTQREYRFNGIVFFVKNGVLSVFRG